MSVSVGGTHPEELSVTNPASVIGGLIHFISPSTWADPIEALV